MSTEKPLIELLESLENSFDEILLILKSMGNKKRLRILTVLLTGEKSFNSLKKEMNIQKTALSNHLTLLITNSLVEKPNYGKYRITQDGRLFIRAIDAAYIKSSIWKKTHLKSIQKRQFSDSFVESLLRKG